jgi:Bifunctional DNA primase/polymerase, N-terminal
MAVSSLQQEERFFRSAVPSPHVSYVYHTALLAWESGISVVPIATDGSKTPALRYWRNFQQRRPTRHELRTWFESTDSGLGLITGPVSGNLEVLDFDDRAVFTAWLERVQGYPDALALYERIAWGYEEATPAGGRHLLYRCDTIAGNQKLAMRPVPGPQRYKTLIETRGRGGLIVIAPSRGRVHPSGKAYMLLRGSVVKIQTISTEERTLLHAMARSFDETPAPEKQIVPVQRKPFRAGNGSRPGDIYNARATWDEVLKPAGWEFVRTVGNEGHWRRPGKDGPGISATTNFEDSDLLYVFSTSTPFEPERGYTKFAAYAVLNHGGDFSAAARELVQRGYCE